MTSGITDHKLAVWALLTALLQAVTAPAHAKKQPVIFTSPCECQGNHGVSRWSAKTDLQEPPTNEADIKKITPAQLITWQGPGGKLDQHSERIAIENQWYAVTGRVERVKIEDDGDLHIVIRDTESGSGMVVELPLGPRWCDLRKMVFSWTDAQFPMTGKFRLTQNPIVTVIGKIFYDIDHSGNDTVINRRNYDQSLSVWEIHPIMKIVVQSTDSARRGVGSSSPPIASPAMTLIPQTTKDDEPFITLTRPVTIQIPFGTAVLPAGTKLPVLSRDAQNVDIRYMDARYSIPISSTDAH